MEPPTATEPALAQAAPTKPAAFEPPTAPARSATRARVPHLAALPKSLERFCLSASPGTPEATSLAAEATALR